jgi:hypothetical protein
MAKPENDALTDLQKVSYQTYLDERKSLNEAEREQVNLLDKSTITIASGALALSLTFIGDIVEQVNSSTICLVWLAWFFLILSMMTTLASFRFSVHAYQRQRVILDSENAADGNTPLSGNAWATTVEVTNWISLLSLVNGVACLAVFVGLNTFK